MIMLRARMHANVHTYAHIRTTLNTNIRTYAHLCTHMHTSAHIRTHMHAYAPIREHTRPYAAYIFLRFRVTDRREAIVVGIVEQISQRLAKNYGAAVDRRMASSIIKIKPSAPFHGQSCCYSLFHRSRTKIPYVIFAHCP